MPYKVLVVDDEPCVRDLFTDLLKREGYAACVVSSGEEALSIIERKDFDVVLLDIKLAGISGIETLKKIKEKNQRMIVIMITGFSYDEELVGKSRELGCSGFIGKNMPIVQIMSNFKLFVDASSARLKKSKRK